jgi:sugar phosphate isomerase/epimerase
MLSRRALLGRAAAVAAGAVLRPWPLLAADRSSPPLPAVSLFTKHLVGLPFEQLAEVVAEIGVTGIEAPVRLGGHVEPARVEEGLPRLVEALRRRGLTITMLTTGINEVSAAARTETMLRTARALGIPRFRMNWYAYDGRRSPWVQLEEIKPKLRDLVQLSREIGIQPCYQNHSGAKYVGAGIWDMAMLMRDHPAAELAWAFDIMHATIEGSTSWPTEFDLVRDRLGMAYFKNFAWAGKGHRPAPLAEGVVGRPYVDRLQRSGFAGPICLHVEYLPEGTVKDAAYIKEAVATSRQDLATLRGWWG